MTKLSIEPGSVTFVNYASTRTYTEREKVLAERAAFENGLVRGTAREFQGSGGGMPALKAAVAKAFPLPKVVRPRIVRDADGVEWKRCTFPDAIAGPFDYRPGGGHWRCLGDMPLPVTPERVKLWADLLANPTEEVEE